MTDPWNTDDADSADWTDLDDEVSDYVSPDIDAHFTQDVGPRVVAELPGGRVSGAERTRRRNGSPSPHD